MMTLTQTLLFSIALFTTTTAAIAHEGSHDHPDLTMIMNKDLANIPGKEVIMLTVNYKPGEVETPHKHEAHAFVYVLEGEIVMAVKGGKELILSPGQSFYEGPEDIHTVGRNASKTKPAKFLVLLLKDKNKAPVLPLE
ncbi:cupin domain-containing protein [Methylophilus sp. 'Pure River']|uniref:cupin domain-containing protein n=1 Tax=Methylophilus sp. 'Pure River' TaxID=3377117 RepID=UPI00398EF7DE